MTRTAKKILPVTLCLGLAPWSGAEEPIQAPLTEEVSETLSPGAQLSSGAGDALDDQTAKAVPTAELAVAEPPTPEPEPTKELDLEMEDVKKALLGLKRDLVILEEDLLFPASSQVSVFLSLDVGEFFSLDAVTLKLNGKEVNHHLYTKKQVGALLRGGVQKLYVGNVKQGDNRVTAFFTGTGKEGRDFRRATRWSLKKALNRPLSSWRSRMKQRTTNQISRPRLLTSVAISTQ